MPEPLNVADQGLIPQKPWHALKSEDVLRDLKVHNDGLTSEEASQRRHRYGHNELDEAKRETLKRLIGTGAFIGPIVVSFAMADLSIDAFMHAASANVTPTIPNPSPTSGPTTTARPTTTRGPPHPAVS